jgi:hypothetical protein
MIKVKLKKVQKPKLSAIGFGSVQAKPLGNDEYEIIDHAGRPEKDLIDLLKRCDDVDRIDKV